MTKQEKIINDYLKLNNIEFLNLSKSDKNKYSFEVYGAEKFKMYKHNYKRITVESFILYFEHKSKNIFQCTLNK